MVDQATEWPSRACCFLARYGCDVKLEPLPSPHGTVLWSGSNLESEAPSVPLTSIAVASTTLDSTITVRAHSSTTLMVVSAYVSSLDPMTSTHGVVPMALQALENATQLGAAALRASHTAAWQEMWENRIEVEGNDTLASAVNASLYFILSSIREDWKYGLSPGGLASGGYHGHTCVGGGRTTVPSLCAQHVIVVFLLLFFHKTLHMHPIMRKCHTIVVCSSWHPSPPHDASTEFAWPDMSLSPSHLL